MNQLLARSFLERERLFSLVGQHMFGGLFSGLANVSKGIFGGVKSGVGKLGAMGGQGEGMEGLSRGQKAAKIGTHNAERRITKGWRR